MLSFHGSAMLAWNFRTFNLSHRLTLLQSETLDCGMNCHKACIVGLIPKPRGSSVVPEPGYVVPGTRAPIAGALEG